MRKILYISGSGRSGTTLIGNILGQVDGICNAGQIFDVWTRGVESNVLCGCGKNFHECELWREVFKLAFDGMDKIVPQEVMHVYKKKARIRQSFTLLSKKGQRQFISDSKYMREYMKKRRTI